MSDGSEGTALVRFALGLAFMPVLFARGEGDLAHKLVGGLLLSGLALVLLLAWHAVAV